MRSRRGARCCRPGTSGADTRTPGENGPHGGVTLAFARDVQFKLHLAAFLDHPRGALGPIARTLADADLSMVNLESAITDRGTPEAKKLEVPNQRFHFRTSPAALDVLAAARVDVVTRANNHGADYGPVVGDSWTRTRIAPNGRTIPSAASMPTTPWPSGGPGVRAELARTNNGQDGPPSSLTGR